MHPLLFDEVTVAIRECEIRFRSNETDLKTIDAVLVRTMPPGTLEQVVARMDVLAGLQDSGIIVLNAPRALECAVDKYLTTQRLAMAGLPVPATIVCESSDAALAAFEQLGRDIVVKPLFGAEGRGIMRVSDPELALRCFRTLERLGAVLYLQQFLHGPAFDIRVLLLDGQLVGSMKRTPRQGEFRANMAQHGTAVPYVPSDHELELSIRAAYVTGCVFAGIDLMYDACGKPVVIQVNAVPGWRGLQDTCGICVPTHLFDWLERATGERISNEP